MNQASVSHRHTKLGELAATAICGNDILSSTLYVSGIAVIFAGVYAPLVLLFIALILYFYKHVYTEVVEALPINGGAYNCLLNGTSKTVAAIAGVTTILSYVATAVISAKVGVEYFHTIVPWLPILPATIGLLFLFALLVIGGLKDSAKVAIGIFIFHIVTLVIFVVVGLAKFAEIGPDQFINNLHQTQQLIAQEGSIWKALFFGFSASLLGVSGFESSANFVEEQQRGVFRKTLRNMLIGVAIFNPLIALVALGVSPIDMITGAKDFLLAEEAQLVGGNWMQYLVAIDALLVLAGAVLTAYVGVSGLVYRMASDACLPGFLAKINNRDTYPRIVISFFLLCTSILLITRGNLLSLAGVYTISFLGVMSLFALGNLILRETRTELKRTYSAPLPYVLLAFCATFLGIFGNIRIDEQNLVYFEFYFIPALLLVSAVVYQDTLIRFLLRISGSIPRVQSYLEKHFADLTNGTFIAFIHHPRRLYEILEYINRNEVGRNIILVHCRSSEESSQSYRELQEMLPVLKKAGVFPHLNLTLEYIDKPFGPAVVNQLSRRHGVRKNRIVIGSIHHEHHFDYADFEGVRIIF